MGIWRRLTQRPGRRGASRRAAGDAAARRRRSGWEHGSGHADPVDVIREHSLPAPDGRPVRRPRGYRARLFPEEGAPGEADTA